MSVRDVAPAAWFVVCAATLSFPGTALADKIDGSWCHGASSFTIEGPHIVTPAGSRVVGLYTRHSFAYIIPAGEAEAGSEVRMQLLSEEALQLTRAGAAQSELWQRCNVTS